LGFFMIAFKATSFQKFIKHDENALPLACIF